MSTAILILIVVSSLETLLTSERPRWLARLARLPLTTTRRLALADARHPVDEADYRRPAMEGRPPWAGVPELHADGLRIVPDGDAFAVAGTGWRRNRVLRVEARRDGDEVVLRAAFVPAPITSIPLLLAIAGIIGARLAAQTAPSPELLGMLAGVVIGLAIFVSRARTSAESDATAAFDAIEAEMVAAASQDRPGADRPPAPPRWRARSPALVPLALVALALLTRASIAQTNQEEMAQALVRQYGISPEDARRFAPHALEAGTAIAAHPRFSGTEGSRELTLGGLARLGDDDIAARHAIMTRLAERSPELCAQFATGALDDRMLFAVLAREDDATLETWFALARSAATLALDEAGEPPQEDPSAILSEGYDAMIASLPEDRRAEYERRLFPESDADEDASCDAYRALAEGIERLSPRQRAEVLRALLAVDATGSESSDAEGE